MMSTWRAACKSLLGTMALLVSGGASVQEPHNVTVCQLNQHGSDFDGKHVHVQAVYQADMRHFAFLTDAACPGSSIDEDEPHDVRVDSSVKVERVWSYKRLSD